MVNGRSGEELKRTCAGHEQAFGLLVRPHQVALFRHCYRMLGSGPDAEDAVQDTLLRGFRAISTYNGTGDFAAWLYRIATNVCLDRLRGRRARSHPVLFGPPIRRVDELGVPADRAAWVEPVGDDDLGIALGPEDVAIGREAVSLAFVASLHSLPPRQRAALLLHDVLGFSQLEVAEVLAATPSAVNSLLHRARETATTIAPEPPLRLDDPRAQDLARRYVDAWERADLAAFIAVVTDDVTFSMPPLPQWFAGRQDVCAFIEAAVFAPSRPLGVTLHLGRCNGQLAAATYEPAADGVQHLSGVQVLDVRGADVLLVSGVTSYRIPELALRLGYPATVKSGG